ncbi:Anion exchange protein 3 [Bienertia sinuspersici]
MADTFTLSSHVITLSSLQITSLIFPIDAVAPPPIRSRRTTSSGSRTLLKRRRRTRRKSPPSDGEDDGVFFGGDDGGLFGGFGGGRGWNFGGDGGGGFNWNNDGSSPTNPDDPAFDFVYEVICWIVFSNCLHFAFKKILRLLTEEREKVPMRIASVC